MIVHLTDEAERDLEQIGDFIASDNPARALSFVVELRAKCLGLADMPRAFPLIPRFEISGVRRRLHGSYLIFYRILEDRIDVLHVLHGATNYTEVLFPD